MIQSRTNFFQAEKSNALPKGKKYPPHEILMCMIRTHGTEDDKRILKNLFGLPRQEFTIRLRALYRRLIRSERYRFIQERRHAA